MTGREAPPADLPFSPAAERNRAPILAELSARLAPGARILEIGAGTGQHAAAFSQALPGVRWLPTDREPALNGLRRRTALEGASGLQEPRALDVDSGPWPEEPFDAAYTANTCHIMPWSSVCAMLRGVASCLPGGGRFFIYGPFREGGAFRSPGDERFDRSLRRADPEQGIRDLETLEAEAERHHFEREARVEMPANNLLVVFRLDDASVTP